MRQSPQSWALWRCTSEKLFLHQQQPGNTLHTPEKYPILASKLSGSTICGPIHSLQPTSKYNRDRRNLSFQSSRGSSDPLILSMAAGEVFIAEAIMCLAGTPVFRSA